MKKSLSEIKSLVTEHKRSVPKLSAGKSALYKFAVDKGLISHEEKPAEPQVERKREKIEKVKKIKIEKPVETTYVEEVKKATKKEDAPSKFKVPIVPPLILSKKKEVIKEKVKEEPKKPKAISLSAVQAIKKQKGVTLKEAWAIFKNEI